MITILTILVPNCSQAFQSWLILTSLVPSPFRGWDPSDYSQRKTCQELWRRFIEVIEVNIMKLSWVQLQMEMSLDSHRCLNELLSKKRDFHMQKWITFLDTYLPSLHLWKQKVMILCIEFYWTITTTCSSSFWWMKKDKFHHPLECKSIFSLPPFVFFGGLNSVSSFENENDDNDCFILSTSKTFLLQ